MDNIRTGIFIAERRKELGYNQKDLAEKLNITDKAVSKWETGRSAPDVSILIPLAEELEVSVAELMDGEISEEKSVRTHDDAQILDLLRRTQELEKQKNLLYGIILIVDKIKYITV